MFCSNSSVYILNDCKENPVIRTKVSWLIFQSSVSIFTRQGEGKGERKWEGGQILLCICFPYDLFSYSFRPVSLFVFPSSWPTLIDGGHSCYGLDTLEPAVGWEHSQNTDLVFFFCFSCAREHHVVLKQVCVWMTWIFFEPLVLWLAMVTGGQGDWPWWDCPRSPDTPLELCLPYGSAGGWLCVLTGDMAFILG